MTEESSAVFREDRGWMYTGRRSRDSITPEWADRTTEFVERAFRRVPPDHAARGVLCPCARCGNTRRRSKYDMQIHLCKHGFRPGYTVWVHHGESHSRRPAKPSDYHDDYDDENGDLDGKKDAERAEFLDEKEVSSKPQGVMKREISLIQEYTYSKLRKEDQIEWDYQKYLWEKEKLRRRLNVSKWLPEELKRIRLEGQRQLLELRETLERRSDQYEAHWQDFMTTVYSCVQAGTQLSPVPQMPPMLRLRGEESLAYERRCEQDQAQQDHITQYMTIIYRWLKTCNPVPPMPQMPTFMPPPPPRAPNITGSTGSNGHGGGPSTRSPITPCGSTSSSHM